ncbi:MAG: helix-turn-helix domain-containing protein [Solirubrobacteraceae bacterium]
MLLVAMDQSELLTVSQVADALGASTQSIRNWIRAEQLDAVRIGNRFLISQAEVDRLRGDLAGSRLESPWESDPDAPAEPLRRARSARSEADPAGRLLGG